jgi:hypothetical protein
VLVARTVGNPTTRPRPTLQLLATERGALHDLRTDGMAAHADVPRVLVVMHNHHARAVE